MQLHDVLFVFLPSSFFQLTESPFPVLPQLSDKTANPECQPLSQGPSSRLAASCSNQEGTVGIQQVFSWGRAVCPAMNSLPSCLGSTGVAQSSATCPTCSDPVLLLSERPFSPLLRCLESTGLELVCLLQEPQAPAEAALAPAPSRRSGLMCCGPGSRHLCLQGPPLRLQETQAQPPLPKPPSPVLLQGRCPVFNASPTAHSVPVPSRLFGPSSSSGRLRKAKRGTHETSPCVLITPRLVSRIHLFAFVFLDV